MPSRAPGFLDEGGRLLSELPMTVEHLRGIYEAMVEARVCDAKCTAMQVQGRLATYAPFEGQEAAQIGAVATLRPDDWLVATYRDAAAMSYHGYPWTNLILGRTGDERGGNAPQGVNVLPPSITVGGHMIHAVGIAWAQVLRGSEAIALTMFGDGATSEGDFHEAMNFAGVYHCPIVFLCQNNGWAISLPRERQTASETIAQKAEAYGFEGVVVDGNDVVAVHTAVSVAIDRARRGDGPTLIEALTYRLGDHTTTDDSARYRGEAEVAQWRGRDPLIRVRRYLEAAGEWDDGRQRVAEERAAGVIEEAVARAEALEPLGPHEIFEAMFESPTQQLENQRRHLARDGR